jgi:hypothetical protein
MVFQLSNQITLSSLKLILLEDMEEYITSFAHLGFLLSLCLLLGVLFSYKHEFCF